MTNKLSETKPFRSPLFPGMRIRIRSNGDIIHHGRNKTLAYVDMGRKIVVGKDDYRGAKAEALTKFVESDFLPIIASLRKQERERDQAIKQAAMDKVKRDQEIRQRTVAGLVTALEQQQIGVN